MQGLDGDRSFTQAIRTAQAQYSPERWNELSPQQQSAAIYHELCRIDTGCRRGRVPAGTRLPPCKAPRDFRDRRGCAF